MLAFDADKHEYRWNGRVIPSVTTVIKSLGLTNADWYTDDARDRGQMVHLATALDDRGELDESTVDERIAGYLDAWRHWRKVSGLVAEFIEQPVYSAELDYAGTPDRVGIANGLPTIVDIKNGQPECWHPLQTAAYAIACYGFYAARGVQRLVVYLSETGAYRTRTHSDMSDLGAWRGAIDLHNWRANNGKA